MVPGLQSLLLFTPLMRTPLLTLLMALLFAVPLAELSRHVISPLARMMLSVTTRYRFTSFETGIPVFDYGEVSRVHVGKQYNPLFIAAHGLRFQRRCLKGNKKACQWSQSCADWLVSNARHVDDFANLEYHFTWPRAGMKPPWRSGLANSRAWQLLDRVAEYSGKAGYRETARRLVRSFKRSVEEGGVTSKSPSGWWYLEYVGEGADSPRVLNGMMSALLGLHDFYIRNHDAEAKTLFEKGVQGLEAEIHLFDDEGYSFYSAAGGPSGTYHGLHVQQLQALVLITGSPVLEEYRDRWASYPLAGQLLKRPTAELLLILSLNFLVLLAAFSSLTCLWYRFRKRPRLSQSASKRPPQDERI